MEKNSLWSCHSVKFSRHAKLHVGERTQAVACGTSRLLHLTDLYLLFPGGLWALSCLIAPAFSFCELETDIAIKTEAFSKLFRGRAALTWPTASRILGSHLSLAIAMPSTEHIAAGRGGDCKRPWREGCVMVHGICGRWWKVLEMESGVGLHKSVNIFNATEFHTYKWLKR